MLLPPGSEWHASVEKASERASIQAEKEAEEAARAAAIQVYVLTGHCEKTAAKSARESPETSLEDQEALADAVAICTARATKSDGATNSGGEALKQLQGGADGDGRVCGGYGLSQVERTANLAP